MKARFSDDNKIEKPVHTRYKVCDWLLLVLKEINRFLDLSFLLQRLFRMLIYYLNSIVSATTRWQHKSNIA